MLFMSQMFSQEIKLYKGRYTEEKSDCYGEGEYSYYEDVNFERIFHGKFELNLGSFLQIVGKFNNNKREGIWGFVRNNNGLSDAKTSEILNAKYSKGNLNGLVTYVMYDNKSHTIIKESSVQYKDNILIGNFSFKSTIDGFSIFIPMDSNGFINGNSRILYFNGNYEDVSTWKHGVLISRLHRNLSSGEVYIKYDKDKDKRKFDSYEFEGLTSNWPFKTGLYFWSDNIPYLTKGLLHCDNPIHVMTRGLTQVKFNPFNLELSDSLEVFNNYILKANECFINHDFINATIFYQNAQKLRDNDSINRKLQLIKSTQYDVLVLQGDSSLALNDFEKSVSYFTQASQIKSNDEVTEKLYLSFVRMGDKNTEIKKYNESIENYKSALKIKPNDTTGIKKLKVSKLQFQILNADKSFSNKEYTSALKMYKAIENYQDHPNIITNIDSCNYYIETKSILEKAISNQKQINEIYNPNESTSDQTYNPLTGQSKNTTKLTRKKEYLYNAYFAVYDNITKNNPNNKDQIIELVNLQIIILNLIDKGTFLLERKLKRTQELTEIIKILKDYK